MIGNSKVLKCGVIALAAILGFIGLCASVSAEDKPAPPLEKWVTSLALNFNLTQGNSDTMLLNGAFLTEYKGKSNEMRFGLEGNYGRNEITLESGDQKKETNVQNAKAFAGYKRLFTERLYGYLSTELAHDKIAEIDSRFMAGPGAGYYLIKCDAASLGLEVGATYIRTELSNEDEILPEDRKDKDTVALRIAERFEYAISKTSKFWESAEYLPSFDDFSIYLLTSEIGIEAAMNDWIALRLLAQDKYNSDPPMNIDENDIILLAGLKFTL